MGILEGGDGTGLDQELIDTDQTANVARGHILDGLNVATHHQNGTLDGLLVQILLLAGCVVGAHDAALLAGGNLAGEHTSEGVETSLIGGRYHLGDVHHQRTIGIASLDSDGSLIIMGTLVQHLHTVLLGNHRGWQMDGNHLKQSLTGWQPGAHHSLQQSLAVLVLILVLQCNTDLGQQIVNLLLLVAHDGIEHLVYGVQNVHAEGTLVVSLLLLLPFLCLGVEEVLTPQTVKQDEIYPISK